MGDNPFGAHTVVDLAGDSCRVAHLGILAKKTGLSFARLPYSIRVLLENALRFCGQGIVGEEDVLRLLKWDPASPEGPEFAFTPARVLLQDFTGVPCVVDLAALRSAFSRAGADPSQIEPVVPVDLVVDHSVHLDYTGSPEACCLNLELEMQRNRERYLLLRWAQQEFGNLTVIPPGSGICHQVNLEYLAQVVRVEGQPPWAYPDTVIGTDSHTTTINALGVLGWGVGGIEAEAVMLGEPYFMAVPQVVGVRLVGALSPRASATDLALTVTEVLRGVGVVGRFVEFFGPGVETLSVPDRATVANMAPEYGATCGFFPVDSNTISYLRATGRSADLCARVEAYAQEQGLFREADSETPEYSWVVELDLSEVAPSVAGPRRPQDRLVLSKVREKFREELAGSPFEREEPLSVKVDLGARREIVRDGAVAIASITSCTNTSNPVLMMAAGIVARKAVEAGLRPPLWVRTSMAPGSRAVTAYLKEAGLLSPLEELGFHVAAYGCATCIGNSGPLPAGLTAAAQQEGLVLTAVISGNRNFEARIHPQIRANYLASPALVVAYALAGTVDVDLENDPLGTRADGRPVYLRDLWPTPDELAAALEHVAPEMYVEAYKQAGQGSEAWANLEVERGVLFPWSPTSTYIKEPPFFKGLSVEPEPLADILGARILAVFGHSITTDHISPAGSIPVQSPAGRYLLEQGVPPEEFNSYGARRGNHEVLMRGTFANVRLRNLIAAGREGGWTVHQPSGELMSIYDAAMRYQAEKVPLVIFAGKEYGTGSSRDWAAKGPALLGVRAVIAESFERIHRSNLVGMGILPLELEPGVEVESLGLSGRELVDVVGLSDALTPGASLVVRIRCERAGSEEKVLELNCKARLDFPVEVDYYRHGGILPRVYRLKLNRVDH
ncbi:MAG: aconitate hydratase AcnA [Thermoleophilia bacterium]|nr:aconitate hydratase AcnA [Thermoleophilia bacterium]